MRGSYVTWRTCKTPGLEPGVMPITERRYTMNETSTSGEGFPAWTIPDEVLNPGVSLYEAASALSRVFRILPTTSTPTVRKPGEDASKNPGGLLGKGWQDKTTQDDLILFGWFSSSVVDHTSGPVELGAVLVPEGWYRTVEPSTVGLGLHIGSQVVAVDIDYPDKVPADMWEHLDTAPFQSTSAVDPRRGHYFFRVRDGYYFGQTSAIVGRDGQGSPGEIRHGNAIVVSAPTKHPKSGLGRRYEWKRAGEIPVMSEPVAEWLQSERRSGTWNGAELAVTEASFESIEDFRETSTKASNPEVLAEHLAFMARQADMVGLHAATLGPLIDLMQYALFGFVAAADAIDGAAQQFVRMRIDPSRGDGSWVPITSSEEDARREFEDLLKWACGRVHAKYALAPEAVRYETCQHISYWYGVSIEPMAAPEGYVELPPSVGSAMRDIYHPKETEDENGRILVENAHMPLAEACAERLSPHFQWVMNGGTGEGEWWVYSEDKGVWERGGQRVGVNNAIIDLMRTVFAPYDIIEADKAARSGTRYTKDMIDLVFRLHGRVPLLYRLNSKPAKNMPDINYVVDALKSVPEMWSKIEDFDASGSRVVLANGVLDVKTGAFEATTAAHKVTKRAPVAYDPVATCPKFEKFLIDCVVAHGDYTEAELVAGTIKRYFGAALLGDWQSDNFLVAHGPAGSGKSTVFEDLLCALLGQDSGYWSMITPQVFTRGISEAGRKFELASITGARFLTCNEAFDGASGIDPGFLKAFTDGSKQRAAFKGRDNFLMTPGRVVFMSNELPKLSGVDAGISRRAMFIEFPHGHDKADPLLPDPDEKLFERDIVPELSGILNWVIDGAREYLAVGLNPPVSVFLGTREALSDSSPMGTFLRYFRPVTEDDPLPWRDGSAALSLKDLHDLYKDFLEMNESHRGYGSSSVTPRGLAQAVTSTYRTVGIDMNKREHFYMEDGVTRRKQVAVRGLMPNEDYSAFLVERGVMGPAGVVQRHRIGVGDIEDWRRRQVLVNRPTAGLPI